MRKACLLVLLSVLACSKEEPPEVYHNRFLESLEPAGQIGELNRLTDDDRSGFPLFAPGDSIIYFKKLLVSESVDTLGRAPEDLVRPYGIRISDKELYTLSHDYVYPDRKGVDLQTSEWSSERIIWALESPDGETIAYETVVGNLRESRTVYLMRGDSTVQLTYGDTPCFIDRFSNTGRYLTVICGYGPSRLIIFDLLSNAAYKVPQDGDFIDYMTAFSSDDKMMAFIRSNKQFSIDYDFLGNIWLMTFANR